MLLRLAMPALEVYTHGLYTDDSYLVLVREAVSALRSTQQTPGPENPGTPFPNSAPQRTPVFFEMMRRATCEGVRRRHAFTCTGCDEAP